MKGLIPGIAPPKDTPVGDDGEVYTASGGKAVWAPLSISTDGLTQDNNGAAIAATQVTSRAKPGLYLVAYDLEVTTADAAATSVAFQVNYTPPGGAVTRAQTALALTAHNIQSGVIPVRIASGQISIQTNVVNILTAKYGLSVRVIPA